MKYLNSISSFFNKKREIENNQTVISKNTIQDYFNLINSKYNLRKLSHDIKSNFKRYDLKESTVNKCIFNLEIHGNKNVLLKARIPFIEIPGPYILSFNNILKNEISDINKEFSYPILYTLYKDGKQIDSKNVTPDMLQSYFEEPVKYATLEIVVRCDVKEPIDIIEEACSFLIRKFGFKKSERTLDTRKSENDMEKKITYIKTIN